MFDVILLVVWGVVTWCVAGEGGFGAAVTCLVIIVSGLLAMNFFEPLAAFAQSNLLSSGAWPYRWDVIMLVGLFGGFVFGLKVLMEKLSPRYIEMSGLAYGIGRWSFGLIGGYVTMAFLLTALHTAPLPRNFMEFRPERANLFGIIAPDRQWLGFTQYASESLFASGRIFDGPVSDFIDDQADNNRNTVWPSFPIRYASRREQFAAGGLIAPPTVAPAATPSSRQGSGSGAAGF
jgi:lipid-A-disaccharide synthase-like uncharacterized protein